MIPFDPNAKYPKTNQKYLVEGYWSYNNRLYHTHIESRADRAEILYQMGSIMFTDGTCLYFKIRPLQYKESIKVLEHKDNYLSLINKCLDHNIWNVEELNNINK